MARTACETCKGTGHDKNSFPEVKVKVINAPDPETGKTFKKKKFYTHAQGSGCLDCGGIGFL